MLDLVFYILFIANGCLIKDDQRGSFLSNKESIKMFKIELQLKSFLDRKAILKFLSTLIKFQSLKSKVSKSIFHFIHLKQPNTQLSQILNFFLCPFAKLHILAGKYEIINFLSFFTLSIYHENATSSALLLILIVP